MVIAEAGGAQPLKRALGLRGRVEDSSGSAHAFYSFGRVPPRGERPGRLPRPGCPNPFKERETLKALCPDFITETAEER